MYICGTIFIDFVSVHTETANPRAMVEMGQLGKKTMLQLNVVWCGFYYELVQAILISLHIFTFQSQQWELKSIKFASKYVLSQFMLIDLISVIIIVSIND